MEEPGRSFPSFTIHTPRDIVFGRGKSALLADYLVYRKPDEQLDDYLQNHVFAGMKQMTVSPDAEDEKGFNRYMERFVSCIPAQKAAADCFKK